MGFVRGHLLVEMSGRYEELTKLIKVADGTGSRYVFFFSLALRMIVVLPLKSCGLNLKGWFL